MRIAVLGAGPAGLYFAILRKQAAPADEIVVVERNRADDPNGWGIVFSDGTLANLRLADAESHDEIVRNFHHWDAIDVHFKGARIRTLGHGFAGISRRCLLNILQRRAAALGVQFSFATTVVAGEDYARDFDLVVAADGVNSATRCRHPDVFQPEHQAADCRFIWLGARHRLEAFTFDFRQTDSGWFNLHAYRYDADWSTYIVETPGANWRSAGLDLMTRDQSLLFCEQLFGQHLDGAKLAANASVPDAALWQQFHRVLCRRWYHRNIVLIGDAAHTAHFSIGSGTRMAMEDAIALAAALVDAAGATDVAQALAAYQRDREPYVMRLQSAARNRMSWFENVAAHAHLEPVQFAYSLLTGSQRVGHASLRQRDSNYVDHMEGWLAERNGLPALPVPPMFLPLHCRGLQLSNRVAVAPMAMYVCGEGVPGEFHQTHLGAFALGGAGLIFTEMTAVTADARITPLCAGIWNDEQALAWQRIVDFVHRHSSAKIAMQLGHAGPKGSTRPPWEGSDQPLSEPRENWPLLAASNVRWAPQSQTPQEMTRHDMQRVCADFVAAAGRAAAAGFDMLELHCAHGYLLSAFISPLSNRRVDEYGGSLENRCRFPLAIFAAVRAVWPADRPISVRISAVDWLPGGNTPEDGVAIAKLFKAAGADLIHVSSGQTSPESKPVYGRMYQTPLADRIRNEVDIATIAVGNITEPDEVNTIIAAGRADLCAVGRPHLLDPHWTHRAAVAAGFADSSLSPRYASGYLQFANQLKRDGESKPAPK